MKEQDAASEGYEVDEKTLGYYSDRADELLASAREERPVYIDILRDLLEPGASILDVGAGLGRDVHLLSQEGFDVIGVDPNEELLARGQQRFGIRQTRLKTSSLPDLKGVERRQYNAVLCALVLQHIPDTALLDALYTLQHRVAPGGFLLLTVPTKAPANVGDLPYYIRSPEQYQFFLGRLGLDPVRQLDFIPGDPQDPEARLILFSAQENEGGLRAIETLESILIEDQKVNTYKYALLRALANLASHRYNAASWSADGNVAVPLDLVAKEWITYYWPIVEAEARQTFILQGHKRADASDITFRRELRALTDEYLNAGGLNAFSLDLEADRLTPEIRRRYRETMTAVKRGIAQPVHYSGNQRTGKEVFQMIGRGRERRILFAGSLWTELSLMSRWIADSIILRWAQFSADLGQQTPGVTTAQVLNLLLPAGKTDRDVALARKAYNQKLNDRGALDCVWSGKVITSFAVDHAIPFSLWGNNDLWNLLPVDPEVNSQKSAAIPTRRMVESRKEPIIHAWEFLYTEEEKLFLYHAGGLIGSELSDFRRSAREGLFSTFKDAIEYTATNRVARRWELA